MKPSSSASLPNEHLLSCNADDGLRTSPHRLKGRTKGVTIESQVSSSTTASGLPQISVSDYSAVREMARCLVHQFYPTHIISPGRMRHPKA